MCSRREFLKKIILAGGIVALKPRARVSAKILRKFSEKMTCTIFRAINSTPDENLRKVIQLCGSIEQLIGTHDVVLIKPNVQWWNHGAPNLSALKALVDLIMNCAGGFEGEVVIAENCHRGPTPWTSASSGWANTFNWNADHRGINNFNELARNLKESYGNKFSTCHWIDVDSGGRRVFSPKDGFGYVYCDGTGGVPLISLGNQAKGIDHRAVVMSYPIFKTDKGTVIDFKKGIWEKGAYTEKPLRFINFAALNHHSTYCGATSCVKNYLGISDLSGGPDPYNGGRLTKSYFNFHSFPFNKWAPGPEPGMLGAEIGMFMNTIRKADINITTAEWVGLASRTKPPVARTRAVLACSDPVALDYHACKYILFPNSKLLIHDPDNEKSPLRHYLKMCAKESGSVFDEIKTIIQSYDFETKSFQSDDDLVIEGEKKWGIDFKSIMKYLFLRYHER